MKEKLILIGVSLLVGAILLIWAERKIKKAAPPDDLEEDD
jgi:hypothetical protein